MDTAPLEVQRDLGCGGFARMTIAVSDAAKRIGALLEARGYVVVSPSPVSARLFLTKRGHSFGVFLPYTDHVAVHVIDDDADAAALERLHAATREYSESQMRVPRPLRYRVPNAVTVFVSEGRPSPEVVAAAERVRLRSHLDGGAKDSTYLIILADRSFHGTAVESTPTRYGGSTDTSINPTNRVRRMMDGLVRGLF